MCCVLLLPKILMVHSYSGRSVKQLQFFNTLAHEKGFHPIGEPHQWYGVSAKDVLTRHVCTVAVGVVIVVAV